MGILGKCTCVTLQSDTRTPLEKFLIESMSSTDPAAIIFSQNHWNGWMRSILSKCTCVTLQNDTRKPLKNFEPEHEKLLSLNAL